MQLVLGVIYFTVIHFCNYFHSSVMYNNKQDFVPPLVIYGIIYLTNMESFLYFLNMHMGSLVIILLKSYNIQKRACTKDSCQQTILYVAFSQ